MTEYQIGVDIGGTHTDSVVLSHDGDFRTAKAPSTPDDFSNGVINSLTVAAEELGLELEDLLNQTELFVNGSTVATNTMTELDGARTGLLTTRGFEDTLRIARSAREQQEYDLHEQTAPPNIVPNTQIVGIEERVDHRGNVVVELDDSEVREALHELIEEQDCEVISVCFLWSFENPTHERAAGEIIEEEYPETYYSLSHEVYPIIREYERTTTTVFNSYTAPRVVKYIQNLREKLRSLNLDSTPMIMHSEGGYVTPEEAQERPVALANSGPAAGVIGASEVGSRRGDRNIITADMGGTSYDTSVIYEGEVPKQPRAKIGEFETGLNIVDVVSIGSGGGSIAWVDNRGAPNVGPRSAGADPGPPCYGKGGEEPTITDAILSLGYLNPEYFLKGRSTLSVEKAHDAIREQYADPLDQSVKEASAGIYRLVVAQMANATRSVSVERGHDPRQFSYYCFGGATACFAAEICRELNINDIFIPRDGAVFSARGLMEADYTRNYLESFLWKPQQHGPEPFNEFIQELQDRALRDMEEHDFQPEDVLINARGDFRFSGQSSELPISIPRWPIDQDETQELLRRFETKYEQLYGEGTAWEDASVEMQNLRMEAVVPTEISEARARVEDGQGWADAKRDERRVYLPKKDTFRTIDIYNGDVLDQGIANEGPMIVECSYTTIFVPSDGVFQVDETGHFNLTLRSV